MILASQNLEDFDVDGVRELTRPLFAIPTHQFLFNAGSVDKKFYMDNLQLEPAEFELIRYPQRGVCLYRCGNERYLLEACRAQLEHKLGKDAVRIPVHYRWEDLVLPDPQKSCFGTPAIRCGFIIRCIIAGALNRSWPMEEACL